MTLVLGLLTFFFILGALILVHELGHFAFAKLFGVRVEEFGVGFPPRLKVWRRGDTIYSVNAVPMGGFVRMLGENGEDDETDSFGAKPPWQRIVILASGASMNLILAISIFFFAFVVGSPRGITVVTGVASGSPAAHAGIKVGDRIVALDGVPVKYLNDLRAETDSRVGKQVSVTIRRDGRLVTLTLVPRKHPPVNQGAMGVALGDTTVIRYGPAEALSESFGQVGTMVSSIPLVLNQVFQHGGQGVQGPIGIAHDTTSIVGQEPRQGPSGILLFAAFLSANLGVLNLLPVPALDGGRILFVLISWIRRRNLDPQVEGLVHLAGMALLVAFIILISAQDLVHWISGQPF